MAIRIDSSMNYCGFRADAASVMSLIDSCWPSRRHAAAPGDVARQRSGEAASFCRWRMAMTPGDPFIYLKFHSLPLPTTVPAGRT